MKNLCRAALAVVLAICLLASGIPGPFVSAAAEGMQALAKEAEAQEAREPQSDACESGGWLYRICADGNAELLGYADASATKLELPETLGGAWVVRIAEEGFAENAALRSVTIPAQIAEIPESAFPQQKHMTVYAYSGTAALEFAEKRGFSQRTRSKFDFFEGILDLSELKSSQWSAGGGVLRLEAPYARFAEDGRKLFLPPCAAFTKGLPVVLSNCRAEGSGAVANYASLGFTDAIRSYEVENEELVPDLSRIQILTEGVSLNRQVQPRSIGGDNTHDELSPLELKGIPLTLEPSVKFNNGGSLSGKITYTPKVTLDLEYGAFGIQKMDFQFDADVAVKATAKFSGDIASKKLVSGESPDEDSQTTDKPLMGKVDLCKVPLVSAYGIVSIMCEVSASVTASGEVTINTTVHLRHHFLYEHGEVKEARLDKPVIKDPVLTAKVSITAGISASLTLQMGFDEKDSLTAKIEFGSIKADGKLVGEVRYTTEMPHCHDVQLRAEVSLGGKIGAYADFSIGNYKIKRGIGFSGNIFEKKIPLLSQHYEDLKPVAHCSYGQHTVVFQPGELPDLFDDTTVYVMDGKTLTEPNVRNYGYTLVGWYRLVEPEGDSAAAGEAEKKYWDFFNDVVREDMTLYAEWEPNPEEEEENGYESGKPQHFSGYMAEESLVYYLGDAGAVITGFDDEHYLDISSPLYIEVPDMLSGMPVVAIDGGAFGGWRRLAGITLPDSVMTMGESILADTNVQTVNWPMNLTDVGYGSPFEGDTIKTVVIPEGVTEIVPYAFRSAKNIQSLALPSTIQKIGEYAFEYSGIKSIDIPASVEVIDQWAFHESPLEQIHFADGGNLREIGDYAFYECRNLTGISLPDGATSIGQEAFRFCENLTSITLPDSITTIGPAAFQETSLTHFRAPLNWHQNYEESGDSPFNSCYTLKSIEVPEGVEEIGDYAFTHAGVGNSNTFYALESVQLPSTLKRIGKYAFSGFGNLKQVAIPDGVTTIEIGAFARCGLTSIRAPKSWTAAGSINNIDAPFSGCENLKWIEVPEGVTRIPARAFSGCSVESVKLPSTLKEIGPFAFSDCKKLHQISIPDGVTSLGEGAFQDSGLWTVRLPKSWKTIEWIDPTSNVRHPPYDGCLASYYEIPEGVTEIPPHAFEGLIGPISVSLPSTLTTIGDYAFQYGAMSELTIPASVTSIGAGALECYIDKKTVFIFQGDLDIMGDHIFGELKHQHIYAYIPEGCDALCEFIKHDYYTEPYDYWPPQVEIIRTPGMEHTLRWANTGDEPIPPTRVRTGQRIANPGVPVRKGYRFTGWYRDAACTQYWDFSKNVMPNADLTLYGGWSYEGSDFLYSRGEDGLTIEGYLGDDPFLGLPSELNGETVVALGPYSIPGGVISLSIPKTIRSIDPQALYFATDLTSIAVELGNPNYRNEDGLLFRGSELYAYPQARAGGTYTIPAGTNKIGDYAFFRCANLKELLVPESVRTLGVNAIYGCEALERIHFAADVSAIGNGSLLSCSGDLDITGPVNAAMLPTYADAHYLNYNLYYLLLVQDDVLLAGLALRAGERIGKLPGLDVTDGKQFRGWSKTSDGSELLGSDAVMPQGDLVLFAAVGYPFTWETVPGGVRLTRYNGAEERVRVPAEVDGAAVVEIAEDCFPDASVTLVGDKGSLVETFAEAHGMAFEPLAYTLRFETNGGRKIEPRTLCATDAIELPEPTRTGFEFVDWSSDAQLLNTWTDGTMPAHDLTLYAAWKQVDEGALELSFTFEEEGESVVITGFTGSFGKVDVPAEINGLPVVKIADGAFANNPYLQVVTLPESVTAIGERALAGSAVYSVEMPGVTSIGASAFANCASLSSVKLGENLRELGAEAFRNCGVLQQIELPDALTQIGERAFSGCAWLRSAKLPANLREIPAGAFRDCRQLRAIQIGASVSEIAEDAFQGCESLAQLSVAAGNLYYMSKDNVLFNASGTKLMLYPQGRAGEEYVVPAGVTNIADGAMRGARMYRLTLNEELISIGVEALAECTYLEEVEFDDALRDIGAGAFEGCSNLSEVTLPEGVQSIGERAFHSANLESIYVPEQAKLAADAISGAEDLTIHCAHGSDAERYAEAHGIRAVDESQDVPVTGIALSQQTLKLQPGETAELQATLTPEGTTEKKVTWSSSNRGVAVVEAGKIEARGLGEAVITATAANGASASCTVTVERTVIAPERIQLSTTNVKLSVGGMRYITAEVLPEGAQSVTLNWTIENSAIAEWLNGCVIGKSVGSTKLTVTASGGLSAVCTITVTAAGEESTMDTPDFTLPDALISIEAEAFAGLAMTVVQCPEGLEEIGSRAFANCKKLRQIYIPSTVTEIAEDAFEGCAAGLKIYCKYDTVAERYAQDHGYECEAME